jgi:membrane-bound lytic murein transglycosylase C
MHYKPTCSMFVILSFGKFINIFEKAEGVKMKFYRCTGMALMIGIMTINVFVFSSLSTAVESYNQSSSAHPEDILTEFESRVANIWGSNSVWLPSPKVWVQYETDLGERSAVDFDNGEAQVQIILKASEDPHREMVLAHLRQGVSNLILGDAKDPLEMLKNQEAEVKTSISADIPPDGKEVRVYLVKQGDSLWKIARQFQMTVKTLTKINGLNSAATLSVVYPLKVFVFSSHNLTLDSTPLPMGEDSLLLDQIRMADGRPVPSWLVKEFAAEVVDKQPPSTTKVVGNDGIERQVVSVKFKLVSNHIEVRSRKFQPLVLTHAKKHNLDPALIMAIIHTESVFNPRARSRTPAYGLMQLVPYTGGLEAYQKVYGKKRKLTSEYLYDPENNVELGTTYYSILRNRYMGAIVNPTSRTYCAVAAYNAGASNVGRAFIPKKSIKKATPVINKLPPQEVYTRLVNSLPLKESREYVRKVLKRVSLYNNLNQNKV